MNIINPVTKFVTTEEQTKLTAILNQKTSKPSIEARILSFVTCPFLLLESLFRRIVDANWKNFVTKSRGHFTRSWHRPNFENALKKTNAIFDFHIRNSQQKIGWHSFHALALNTKKSEHWQDFSKPGKSGTCFGNCIAMSNQILQAGRFLEIDEMKKIEDARSFVTLSQSAQFLHRSIALYNKLAIELIIATVPEKTSIEQKKSCIDRHIAVGNLECVKEFALLPQSENIKFVEDSSTATFQEQLTKKLYSSKRLTSKGIVIIGAKKKSGGGHAMLLEFDNEKKRYIFYDNNYGYYRFERLSVCLSGIRAHLKSNKYDIARFGIQSC